MLQLVKKLFDLLPKRDGWKLALLILLMATSAVLELIGIGLLPAFAAILTHPDELLSIPQLSGTFEMLNINDFESLLFFGILALAIVFIVKNIFIVFYRYIEARYLWNRYKLISTSLFNEYMSAPYTFHLDSNSSLILRNVTEEGRILVNNVLSSLLKLTMNLILSVTIVGLLLFADPFITLIIFLFIGGVGGLIVFVSRKRLSEFGKRANFSRGEMIRNVNEGVGGLKDIRVLKRENWFVSRFKNQVKEYTKLQTKFSVILYSNQPVMETFAVLGMLVIALILHFQGAGSERMITIITLFAAAIVKMLPAMREIMRDVNNLNYYGHSVYPIHNDFKKLREYQGYRSGIQPQKHSGKKSSDAAAIHLRDSIEFRNVTYCYPNSDVDAVRNINFSIKKGAMVGLSGETGAGKTTIIDLMLGLLKPQQGSITFDGIDIETYLEKRTDPIGYIPQFIYLSDDTLERNIAFGLPDKLIDQEQLNRAIDLAQLRKVVDGLPLGVKTGIGEHGVRFSGGQRQRIGIARALYNNPDLLIMDEATSALDTETESEIIDAVEKLRGELTILMITHRVTTMKHCDSIITIDNGEISSFESYEEFKVMRDT